ncbi:MAG: hypothetical protein JW959_12770, partial [Pirellulales bacterium]|nr:hypothetical protein [Pirellulales bacterium]
ARTLFRGKTKLVRASTHPTVVFRNRNELAAKGGENSAARICGWRLEAFCWTARPAVHVIFVTLFRRHLSCQAKDSAC